ncbi:MAG: class II aldolase/adducin family protein [Alphaproteobacteria bacterium]|nr:class II aldolase/adducin family protein [Alphaproteobacteria bacterium]
MTDGTAQAIIAIYLELARRNLNTGSAGNVSVRLGDTMLITPTGTTAETLAPGDLVLMPVGGPPPRRSAPSSEWPMHAAIYEACPEAACVVHTHADHCTALSCLGEPLPAFHYMVAAFGGNEVPCAPYATFGTPALASAVRQTIPGHTACLLANHGMIVHGPSPEAALATAIQLETLARQYLLARAAGTPRLLTPAEMGAARRRFRTYGKRPGR